MGDQSKQRYSEKAHKKGYHMAILFAKNKYFKAVENRIPKLSK